MTIFFSTKLGEKARGKNLKMRPTTTSRLFLYLFSFLFLNQITKKKISSLTSLILYFFSSPLVTFLPNIVLAWMYQSHYQWVHLWASLYFFFILKLVIFFIYTHIKLFIFIFYNHIKLLRWSKSIWHIITRHHLNFKLMYYSIRICDRFFFSSIIWCYTYNGDEFYPLLETLKDAIW